MSDRNDTVHGVLVDDSEEDLKYADRLSRDRFVCQSLPPPPTTEELRREVEQRRANALCDIVLLDYRLDAEGTATAGQKRPYRGGTVAALLKEYMPDLPVVLITTEEKLRQSLTGKPQVRNLFDHQILKQRLVDRGTRDAVVRELVDLAVGFKAIASDKGRGWRKVTTLLRADDDSPIVEGLEFTDPPAGTTEIAQWVLHGLLAHPGPLLDRDDARALLGLAPAAFQRAEVQDGISSARYNGVFGASHERWWRNRLQRWLSNANDGKVPSGGERARVIAKALESSHQAIRPAICIWCGGHQVARACALCRQTVDPQHGLVAQVDDRPRWADNAVVCFDCISTGRADGLRFQPGTDPIVRALQTGALTRETSS